MGLLLVQLVLGSCEVLVPKKIGRLGLWLPSRSACDLCEQRTPLQDCLTSGFVWSPARLQAEGAQAEFQDDPWFFD